MKEGWKYKELGAICKTSAGGTPLKTEKEYYENGNIPWLMSGEVCSKYIFNAEKHITQKGVENSSAKIFPKDTVVVAMYGATAGQVSILKFETTTNQAVCGIFPNKELLPEFLYYFFLFYKEALVAQAVGNAQPNISQQKIKKTLIPILSIAEQERIVSILDKAFEKTDAIKANAEENLANAKALFQAALKKELTPKDGWEEKKLGDVALIKIGPFGSLLHKKDYIMGGIPLINPIHMREGKAYPNKSFTVSLEKFSELKQYELKKGDIVLARRGEIGRCALISSSEDCCICGTGSLFVRFHIPMNDNFSILMFQQPFVQNYLVKEATGATMLNINCGIVSNMKVYIPSLKEQNMVVKTLSEKQSLCNEIEQNCQAVIAECDALKQAILQKAFNGEL